MQAKALAAFVDLSILAGYLARHRVELADALGNVETAAPSPGAA